MQAILIFFFHFVNYLTRMKNILHQGIVLHPKAQGKQQRWCCKGKGAIVSRETMAPFPASPHAVGIKSSSSAWLSPAPKGAKKGRLFRGVPFHK